MTSRARMGWLALALGVVGGLLAWRALQPPASGSPAPWTDSALRPGPRAAGTAPSREELEAASGGPPRALQGGRASPSGTREEGGASAPPPPAVSALGEPGGSAAPPRGVLDAGVRTSRLVALLHAAGLVDDERKDPQLSAFEQLAELPEGAPFEAITREGRVVEARGEAPVPVGSPCQLRLLPARKDAFDCAVLAICGGVIVYPDPRAAGGLNACAYGADGLPTGTVDAQATEVDGDPRLTLQLAQGSVQIDDAVPAFGLRILLEGAPAQPGGAAAHD